MTGGNDTAPGGFADPDMPLDLAAAATVADFLAGRGPRLTLAQMGAVVAQALRLLDGGYVHLPAKRALYAIDPVQRLQNLRLRLAQLAPGNAAAADDLWFHREMIETLTALRDLHTGYVLPPPFDRAVAFVPFQIEHFWDGDRLGFLVANVIEGLDWFAPPPAFRRGAEVTHWNDVPIARAVELVAERNAGGNPDARIERGLARLTTRPLGRALPPDEEAVRLAFRQGADCATLSVPWRIVTLPAGAAAPLDGSLLRHSMNTGLDHETDMVRQVRRLMFAPDTSDTGATWNVRQEPTAPPPDQRIGSVEALANLPAYFQARTFDYRDDPAAEARRYGYIRIRSFDVPDHEAFVTDFIALLERLPEAGLIIDVRDNPGGYILSGERLLQTLTPRVIEPEPLQFISSPLSLALCRIFPEYRPWAASIERAAATGNRYSSSIQLSPGAVALCNDKGQRYYGPVALITNALCYSTTDIFAAGFQDHAIGPVVGTDQRTGAGGANVVTLSSLCKRFDQVRAAATQVGNPPPVWPLGDAASAAMSVPEGLPAGIDMRMALRRTLRVGRHAGMELEDLGVTPDLLHRMTSGDVLDANRDLIAATAHLLWDKPFYRLRVLPEQSGLRGGTLVVTVQTRGIGRLDAEIDGWSLGARLVTDGRAEIALPYKRPKTLLLRGYKAETPPADQPVDPARVPDLTPLVASRIIDLRAIGA